MDLEKIVRIVIVCRNNFPHDLIGVDVTRVVTLLDFLSLDS